jgi:hypothetical protein
MPKRIQRKALGRDVMRCSQCGSERNDDDQDSATEEWLRSVGGRCEAGIGGVWVDKTITVDRYGTITVCNGSRAHATRDDVRNLCRALGIELRAGT